MPRIFSSFLLTTLSFLLIGCSGIDTVETSQSNSYSLSFIEVHSWYCDSPQPDVTALKQQLKSDQRFAAAAGYNDVHETLISGVSFAISLEEGSCTTDVMLEQKRINGVIITLAEMDSALTNHGYRKIYEGQYTEDGLSGIKVKVLKVVYLTRLNERAILTYPLEHTDSYYMTLWVEKLVKSMNTSPWHGQ